MTVAVLFDLEQEFGLFYVSDVAVFARFCGRRFAVGIAEHQITDALIFALYAEFFKDRFALVALKHFFGAVDSAAPESQRVGGKHHVAHDQTAVVNARRAGFIGKHHEHGGRAVKRIAAAA